MSDQEDITDGINNQIINAGQKAIDNNSKEAFFVLTNFIMDILGESIKNISLKHFVQYTYILPALYLHTLEDKKDDKLTPGRKMVLGQASQNLKELIWLEIGGLRRHSTDDESQKITNDFYYWAYNGFSRLLFNIVTHDGIAAFNIAMNQYDQISDRIYDSNYQTLSEIRRLEIFNNPEDNEKLKRLREEYDLKNKFYVLKRHVLLGIRYWTFFLYQIGKIQLDLVRTVIERTEVQRTETKEVLEDILLFKNYSRNYFEWDRWDYPAENYKIHNRPVSVNWLAYGFFIDQIRNNTLFINNNKLSTDEMANVEFILNELVGFYTFYEENFEKWKEILNVENIDKLKIKVEPLQQMLFAIKTTRNRQVEQSISDAELDPTAVANFKSSIGAAWKAQAKIARIFRYFGNRENMTGKDAMLSQFAMRNFFEKAKTMFIAGERFQQIYGVEQWGGQIGRWEDEDFFNKILNSGATKVSANSLSKTIILTIDRLKQQGHEPTAILMSPEQTYNELYSDPNFVVNQNREDTEDDLSSLRLGNFSNIPIYYSYSNFLTNKVIACDFKNAFNMKFKTNPNWYENELRVEVTAIDSEHAQRKLAEDPAKWGVDDDGNALNQEESIRKIKTSVLIDIAAILEFEVKDTAYFVIGNVKSKSAE